MCKDFHKTVDIFFSLSYNLSRGDIVNSIFKRRSYRKFLDKEVSKEKIDLLLKAAMQAPSACDQRPWEFYVIRDYELLLKLAEATPYSMCVKNSKVAIIPCYRDKKLKSCDYVICDMSACVENILIEATELGLGAVWIGGAPKEERIKMLREILDIRDDLIPFCIIPVGYPIIEKEFEDRYEKERVHLIGGDIND